MHASKIIVPIGWRHEAERIVPIAAEIAHTFGTDMELVHVVPSLEATPVRERTELWMGTLADEVGATMRRVEHASISRGLLDVVADQPDAVICMAVDADGGPLDVVLGSASEEILRAGHQQCVLVGPKVPAGARVGSGAFVVCVDGSDHSESILPVADSWASTTEAPIWVVAVSGEDALPEDIDETAYVRRTARDLGVADAEWEVLHGANTAKAIIDFAEKVDAAAICMATHGRTGLGRLALGSVTLRVAHGAPCPVITRRPPLLSAVTNN